MKNAQLKNFRANVDKHLTSAYVGEEDDLVQFSGEKKKNVFTVTLKNSHIDTPRTIAMFPGYFGDKADIKDASGDAVDGILSDALIADVIVTGKPKTVKELLAFINRNPSRIVEIKMLVSDSAQFENPINVRKLSPFSELGSEDIVPSNYKNTQQFDDKRVEMKFTDLQIDDQTVMIYTINPGVTVTLNFFISGVLNTAAALNSKVARQNAARQYGQ